MILHRLCFLRRNASVVTKTQVLAIPPGWNSAVFTTGKDVLLVLVQEFTARVFVEIEAFFVDFGRVVDGFIEN